MSKDLISTHNFPINNSISKQLYSFPKANRFDSSRSPLCQTAFYDIKKGAFGDRTTSFGLGNKMEIVNKTPAPPVGKYELNSQFVYNRDKRRGYSFSRDSKSNILPNPQKSSIFPGPGTYNQSRTKLNDKYTTLSYSMAPKLEDPLKRHQNSLGPGQYDLVSALTASGRYFYSKYTSSGCSKLGRAERKPINDPSISPGPGAYKNEEKVSINKTGNYFFSKFRTVESSKFSRSNRPSLADTKPVPGPGAYGQFTQFASLNKSWVRHSKVGR